MDQHGRVYYVDHIEKRTTWGQRGGGLQEEVSMVSCFSSVSPLRKSTSMSAKLLNQETERSAGSLTLAQAHIQMGPKAWWFPSDFQIMPSRVSGRWRAGAPL